jgi:hypothetical protein
MMSLSFPSKLIDYLGAALPVIVFAPESLTFLESVRSKKIGMIQTSLSLNKTLETLKTLGEVDRTTYEKWQLNAHQWAKEEFKFNAGLIRQILLQKCR